MLKLLLSFGVRTRNCPRIDLQPLEFNFELYFGDFGGGGGGRISLSSSKGSK